MVFEVPKNVRDEFEARLDEWSEGIDEALVERFKADLEERSKVAKQWNRVNPGPVQETGRDTDATKYALRLMFRRQRKAILEGLSELFDTLEKAKKTNAEKIDAYIKSRIKYEDADAEAIETGLRSTAKKTATKTAREMRDRDDLVISANERAERWARERSAEMVGKKVNAKGKLVNNPDAEWSIDKSTREALRQTISDAFEEELTVKELAERLEQDYAFSEDRADNIARTEIAYAHNQGAMESYQAAADLGLRVQKAWLVGPEPCEICEENEDAGFIEMDEAFPSGDLSPPAHPRCVCTITATAED